MCSNSLVGRAWYSSAAGLRINSRLKHIFTWKTGARNISVWTLFGTKNVLDIGGKKTLNIWIWTLFGTENVWDIGGKKTQKFFGQQHMAEKF